MSKIHKRLCNNAIFGNTQNNGHEFFLLLHRVKRMIRIPIKISQKEETSIIKSSARRHDFLPSMIRDDVIFSWRMNRG